MSVNTIDQQVLKSAIVQLFEEDKEFLHKMVSFFQAEEKPKKKKLPQDMNDEEHADFMKEIKRKHGLKKEVIQELQELWKDEPPAEELIKMLSK